MNVEHPDLYNDSSETIAGTDYNDEHHDNMMDYPIYRNFVKLHSLYFSTAFMNPKADVDSEAQINSLYTTQDLCKANTFRKMQHNDVKKHYKMAIDVLDEQ